MKKAPSTLISSYKRRQQMGPFILWGAVVLLLVVGLIFLIVWLVRPNSPMMALFASPTPTFTATSTSTETPTLTLTPTETTTPTITMSPTASEPFLYTIEAGDYLSTIALKFNLGDDGVEEIMFLNPYNATDKTGIDPVTQTILVGQVIKIPNPGYQMPTATPIPADLRPGTEILYIIRAGDYLELIASKFNSTVEDIKKTNNIEADNAIQAGDQIKIHVNLVTPTPTKNPTVTPIPAGAATLTLPSPYTATPAGSIIQPTLTATLAQ